MRLTRLSPALLLLVFLVAACSQYSSNGPTPVGVSGGSLSSVTGQGNGGNSPLTAVMQFGQVDVGSNFPPSADPHDQSAHAKDNLVPRTVVIKAGGTVTFNTFGIHQVAIYEDGTQPEDIDATILSPLPAGCPPLPLLMTDGDGLVHRFSNGCGPRTLQWTFNEPGRYLVICAFLPHFEVAMYGWVEVKAEKES